MLRFSILGVCAALFMAASSAHAEKIYWTDSSEVKRSNLDGSGVEVLRDMLPLAGGITLDLPSAHVYWTDASVGTIRRMNLNGSTVQTIFAGLGSPLDVAIDHTAGMIYWTETGKIGFGPLDGSSSADVVTGLGTPGGLAIDAAAEKIYWTDLGTGSISRANLDGTAQETLLDTLSAPSGIALHPASGKMFWTETAVVRSANLDGSGVVDLATAQGQPFGIDVNVANSRVYWVDPQFDLMRSTDLDGANLTDILTTGFSSPQGIAVDGGCGNGFVTLGAEQCDDGNNVAGDGCSPNCLKEPYLFVDQHSTGASLSGWCGAYLTLDDALAVALPGETIYVADGTYTPDTSGPGDPRTAGFDLVAGTTMLGGYGGCGAAIPNHRDPLNTPSILSGDIGVPAAVFDNTYHVVEAASGSVTFNGFTITAGNADGASPDDAGAGIHISDGTLQMANLLVINNNAANGGGGIHVNGAATVLDITNVRLYGNDSGSGNGGGVEVSGGASVGLVNAAFSGNTGSDGGGLAVDNSSVTLIHASFSANDATGSGGGVALDGGSLDIGNSILSGNSAGVGSGEAAQVAVLSGTTTVNYSLIEGLTGGLGGTGNIGGDPLYSSPTGVDGVAGTEDDDLTPDTGSPVIDAADGSVVPADVADLDGDGNTAEQTPRDVVDGGRFVDDLATADTGVPGVSDPDVPDMGAVEVQTCTTVAQCCDLDSNGIRDTNCVWCECAGSCMTIDTSVTFADMGGAFGSCPADTFANVHDRNHALSCFASLNPCDALNIDAGSPFGACPPDGFCNIHDANHAMTSFAGLNTCTCGPMPEFNLPTPIVGKAVINVMASRRTVVPGETFDVRLFVQGSIEDLQSYQLHVEATGGWSGHVVLEDIHVEARRDHVYAGLDEFSAFNVENGQMLAGLDNGGVQTQPGGYLATYTYRASDNATGTFVVDVRHDAAAQDQTYLIADFSSEVAVAQTIPALIRVVPDGGKRKGPRS